MPHSRNNTVTVQSADQPEVQHPIDQNQKPPLNATMAGPQRMKITKNSSVAPADRQENSLNISEIIGGPQSLNHESKSTKVKRQLENTYKQNNNIGGGADPRPGTAPKQQVTNTLQRQVAPNNWVNQQNGQNEGNNRPLSPYSKIYNNRNSIPYP